MAELPDLGVHCHLAECRQLDFLPLKCRCCGRSFCRSHAPPDKHQCGERGAHETQVAFDSRQGTVSYACSEVGCDISERVPVTCDRCARNFCLAHRHSADHQCACASVVDDVTAAAERSANQIQAARLATPITADVTGRSARARATALRVRLMRIKQRAQGDPRVSAPDRLYLLVAPPGGDKEKCSVFVSRRWSAGRALDALADLCGVANANHETHARRLVMHAGASVLRDMSVAVDSVLTDGDEVYLEYELSP